MQQLGRRHTLSLAGYTAIATTTIVSASSGHERERRACGSVSSRSWLQNVVFVSEDALLDGLLRQSADVPQRHRPPVQHTHVAQAGHVLPHQPLQQDPRLARTHPGRRLALAIASAFATALAPGAVCCKQRHDLIASAVTAPFVFVKVQVGDGVACDGSVRCGHECGEEADQLLPHHGRVLVIGTWVHKTLKTLWWFKEVDDSLSILVAAPDAVDAPEEGVGHDDPPLQVGRHLQAPMLVRLPHTATHLALAGRRLVRVHAVDCFEKQAHVEECELCAQQLPLYGLPSPHREPRHMI
mmetsp:Transcript_43083/g.122102  ORF Transcript_43083/g.122102 Transcript_43083/m.122102 type:complete len:297 (+) Transcript_43083:527-1417(+)